MHRTSFKRAPKCTSDKCALLQSPTCDACRHANAGKAVVPEAVAHPPKAWRTGKRAPTCITKKCEMLGVPACGPCRQFNAAIEF